ncbi:MAG TPA: efflux RND transporter periplasmic adaptor subunit [Candidatus Paceibacterota bacterium]|nr:efflux RND transporter periplasmic adaptor subunit [Candidatus Paceibacterota bacterium]
MVVQPISKPVGGRFARIRTYAAAHKFMSTIAILVALGGGWWIWQKTHATPAVTRYVMGSVSRATVVSSVSASGQVSTSDSIDVKPQVSGTITWVGVKAGQMVYAGEALATIDSTDAKQALADAKRQLATDQLTYRQSSAQAPINFQNDQTALNTAKQDLQDDYNSTYSDLVNIYLDLPGVMNASQDVLFGYELDTRKQQWNVDVLTNLFANNLQFQNTAGVTTGKNIAQSDYASAKAADTSATAVYQSTPRSSATAAIDALLAQSITMQTAVAQALQSELNFMGTVSDVAQTNNVSLPTAFAPLQSTTRTNLSTANTDLTTLLNDKKMLTNAMQTVTSDQQTLTLDQVGNPDGSNPISLQVAQNNLQKEEADIASQQANLAKYTVVAPFAGTVSVVGAHVGDTASAAIATVISHTQVADLSLNEVDVAKIALGEKATLTFDAIDGLTLTGTVAEIDSVGTVSQGVVSYDVKISFDTQDSRIKPGMTVNANIQAAVHKNVLVVPSSAVKTTAGQSYVLAFDPPLASSTIETAGTQGVIATIPPVQIPVVTGISDNSNVEIISGLTLGEQIVARTTSSAASTVTTTGAAGAGAGGRAGGFGGGGGIRL